MPIVTYLDLESSIGLGDEIVSNAGAAIFRRHSDGQGVTARLGSGGADEERSHWFLLQYLQRYLPVDTNEIIRMDALREMEGNPCRTY